jgi:hypothetical protein
MNWELLKVLKINSAVSTGSFHFHWLISVNNTTQFLLSSVNDTAEFWFSGAIDTAESRISGVVISYLELKYLGEFTTIFENILGCESVA